MKTIVSSGTRHSLATRGSRWAEKSQILLVCITQEHKVHTTSWPERDTQHKHASCNAISAQNRFCSLIISHFNRIKSSAEESLAWEHQYESKKRRQLQKTNIQKGIILWGSFYLVAVIPPFPFPRSLFRNISLSLWQCYFRFLRLSLGSEFSTQCCLFLARETPSLFSKIKPGPWNIATLSWPFQNGPALGAISWVWSEICAKGSCQVILH